MVVQSCSGGWVGGEGEVRWIARRIPTPLPGPLHLQIATRGEGVTFKVHFRKDASKGYESMKESKCAVM